MRITNEAEFLNFNELKSFIRIIILHLNDSLRVQNVRTYGIVSWSFTCVSCLMVVYLHSGHDVLLL